MAKIISSKVNRDVVAYSTEISAEFFQPTGIKIDKNRSYEIKYKEQLVMLV